MQYIPILELIRLEESFGGTVGVLKINKEIFCFTLEPPDWLNKRDISSIPAQQYHCVSYKSDRYKTYQVSNVPGRSKVLFHAGNTADHTAGCILLGSSVGKLRGDRAVLNSGNTFKEFMAKTKGYITLHLTIKEVY